MERPNCHIVIEVGITPQGDLAFIFRPGAQEKLEKMGLLHVIGEGMATFGEQLRMQGLNVTKKGPALLYGPGGKPVA
jgi:hypothetical protein